ncbi:MAG: hypothetical protein LBE32_01220 [Burkholderiales bacterium]|nr:hypothetical protein [Burkholderiales bacterium]
MVNIINGTKNGGLIWRAGHAPTRQAQLLIFPALLASGLVLFAAATPP